MLSDSVLWASFINGDKEAFSAFYKQSYAKLYSYGISLGMDEEQIRDVIQEIFIKLYTKPQLIKELATIQYFLLASVRNSYINHIKFKRRHVPYHDIENFELSYSVENNTIEAEEELHIIKTKIKNIIQGLTPRQREIIYLRFLHQMSYEEIAQVMNMSEQAARNLTYRAMEKMRNEKPDMMIWFIFLFLIPK